LGEDFGNRERILKLLRYATSNNDDVNTSLADYKARMKEGQKAIYYVTADSLNAAKNSPQLELFKKKGIEVLLMSERVDEWAMNFVQEFDGTPLQNVSKGLLIWVIYKMQKRKSTRTSSGTIQTCDRKTG
jgi:molecular chaperone HtpG